MCDSMSGHQPHYLPSVSYFAKIKACDVFVFSDDVKYVRHDWMNRNRIAKHGGEWQWLTVPVAGGDDGGVLWEKRISGDSWRRKHVKTIQHVYGKEPGFSLLEPVLEKIYYDDESFLSDLCIDLVNMFCKILGLDHRQMVSASGMDSNAQTIPDVSAKLRSQMLELGCTKYISGESGPDYMDLNRFPLRSVYVFHWEPVDYGSLENLSIVDLVAKKGEDAREFLGQWSLECIR